MASAAIISPFQSASTLSSKPGRMREARRASSFARIAASRASVVVVAQARKSIDPIEDVVAFEIAFRRHVVDLGEELGVIGAQHLLDLGQLHT